MSNWMRNRLSLPHPNISKSNWRTISSSNTNKRLTSPSPLNSNSNNWRTNSLSSRSPSPSPSSSSSSSNNWRRNNSRSHSPSNIWRRNNTKTNFTKFGRLSSTKSSLTQINRNNGFDHISSCDNIKNIAIYWSKYFGGSFIDRTRTGYYLSPFKTKLDNDNHIHIFKSNKDNTYPGAFDYNDGVISIKYKNKHHVQYKDICQHTLTDYDINSICQTMFSTANYDLIKNFNNNNNNNTTLRKLNNLSKPITRSKPNTRKSRNTNRKIPRMTKQY